jgi:putative nucleotidyltransferase with HDIG domain
MLAKTEKVFTNIYNKEPGIFLLLFSEGQHYSTINHSINMAALMLNYAHRFPNDFSSITHEQMVQACLLHDIGKVKSPDLVKIAGSLTPAQRDQMQKHPVDGLAIAEAAGITDKVVLSAIYNHHRRVNNKEDSYPPLDPQLPPTEFDYLVGLLDSFEAMTSNRRPYKGPIPVITALEMLKDDVESNGKYRKNHYNHLVLSRKAPIK